MQGKKHSHTCLAMLRDDKGKLWFAGDRRQSWGMHKAQKSPRPKVTKRNGILFAGTGNSAICDLLTEQFDPPFYNNEEYPDSYVYMYKLFMPELLKSLNKEGWIKLDEGRCLISSGSASIIIGVGSDLFELDLDDESIAFVPVDAPYATGCGGMYALGSLLTTERGKGSPRKRLQLALEVAAEMSPGCDSNVDVIHN